MKIMIGKLIVRYEHVKNMQILEREIPKKLVMNKENKDRLMIMSSVLTSYI